MLSWVVILAMFAALALVVLLPRLAGATPYAVLTGSMEPMMPPGTMIVVKPTDAAEIGVGTVITYQLESGEPTVVTHRVVSQGFDGRHRPVFRTQGDANDVPDADWVRPVQIKGEKWYAVPYLGYVSNLLTAKERQMGIYLLVALLLGYALMMWAASLRERHGAVRRLRGAHV